MLGVGVSISRLALAGVAPPWFDPAASPAINATREAIYTQILASGIPGGIRPLAAESPTISLGVANAGSVLAGAEIGEDSGIFTYIGGDAERAGPFFPNDILYQINANSMTDGTRAPGAMSAIGFETDCPRFEIVHLGVGNSIYLVVDGERTAAILTGVPADGNQYRSLVDFTANADPGRRKRIRVECNVSLKFLGIKKDATGDIYPLTTPYALRGVMLGDSFVEGTGQEQKNLSMGPVCFNALGFGDFRVAGFGATGWTKTHYPGFGSTRDSIVGRWTPDVMNPAPDLLVIPAGINDAHTAEYQGLIEEKLDAFRTAHPGSLVYLVGPWTPNGTDTNPAVRTAQAAAVAGRPGMRFLDPLGVLYSKSDGTHGDEAGNVTTGLWTAGRIEADLGIAA